MSDRYEYSSILGEITTPVFIKALSTYLPKLIIPVNQAFEKKFIQKKEQKRMAIQG